MSDTRSFAWLVLVTAVVGLAAVLSNRLSIRTKVPTPAIVLLASAIIVKAVPSLHAPSERTVERLVTLALVCILFDGGMHIGRARFRSVAGVITVVGVAGTFLTVAGTATFLSVAVGLHWYPALLVATAVAPTDPAVVFSVLGQREVSGRSGTLLEGESGANDPVGIALMASLISAGSLSAGAFAHVAWEFALQMGVGAAIGLVGGRALLWFMRHVPLPSEGLYPLRTLAGALLLFAVAVLAHGSGFLAVFVAGVILGDARAPYKREIKHFHTALASLGEIVAFVVLGLTVDLKELTRLDVWLPGLLLGIVVALVVRPLLVGFCLVGSGLGRNERAFVLLAGLKGAVPILLGTSLLTAHLADAPRLYGIVVIVVTFSVIVQGSLVPTLASTLRIPMRIVQPEPWAIGVRLRERPDSVHRLTVAPGSLADGRAIDDLDELPETAWISVVVRHGRLVPVNRSTTLRAGDQIIVLAEPELTDQLSDLFETTSEA
ncbi:MAG TPA: cation:proton antiporter [Jatrophihabitantaceae bacterium]|jgi:cell volume regulation protein A